MYTGNFFNGKKHGHGVMVWKKDGSRYEGNWKNGKFHGTGKHKKKAEN